MSNNLRLGSVAMVGGGGREWVDEAWESACGHDEPSRVVMSANLEDDQDFGNGRSRTIMRCCLERGMACVTPRMDPFRKVCDRNFKSEPSSELSQVTRHSRHFDGAFRVVRNGQWHLLGNTCIKDAHIVLLKFFHLLSAPSLQGIKAILHPPRCHPDF